MEKTNELNKFIQFFFLDNTIADVTKYDSYGSLVDQVSNIVKDDGLNVLLNNAGIAIRSTRLDYVKSEDLSNMYETNSVAPVMLTKVNYFYP